MKARAWPWPLLLAALTAFGLIAGLCGDGLWDALSSVALASVLARSIFAALRR